MNQFISVAWRPVAVCLLVGALTFFPDYQAGHGLAASAVDGAYATVKVAAAMLGISGLATGVRTAVARKVTPQS
jgi:hypothetical protein